MRNVAGLVLTGGASRRFGVDKAMLLVDGERLVDRTVRVLGATVAPVLEVGPGFSGPEAVREKPPGEGPLVAIAAGGAALAATAASPQAVIVVAVDLPRLDADALSWLAGHPASDSVVPVVDGIPQSLCARYTADSLAIANDLVARGERSMRALLDSIPVHYADESEWRGAVDALVFIDIDTREDASALGVEIPD